ncbi:MAG: chemotaxis protein CheW, partial [Clostridiales bacterium]|nr:chemotaxis protein CheW [Clostridiales bacterium]
PSYIEGLINLRGVVIPVFSIRNKFKLPEIAVTEETRMIIVRSKGVLIGLQVDKVKEIVELSDKDLIDPPGIVQDEETKYIRKIARVGDSLVLLMELDGILSAEQKKTIEDMVKEQ